MTDTPPEAAGSSLAQELLTWFARERRDLPWRRTRDPYRIWVIGPPEAGATRAALQALARGILPPAGPGSSTSLWTRVRMC